MLAQLSSPAVPSVFFSGRSSRCSSVIPLLFPSGSIQRAHRIGLVLRRPVGNCYIAPPIFAGLRLPVRTARPCSTASIAVKFRSAIVAALLLLPCAATAQAQYAAQIELLPPIDAEVAEPTGDAVMPEPLPGPTEEIPWYVPSAWEVPPMWSRSFELGLSGSAGNSPTGAIHVGYDSECEGEWWTTTIEIDYNTANADGVETKNNALGNLRADRQLGESKWSLFVKYGIEYDEFRDFGLRVSGSTGLGYTFFDDDIRKLTASFGAGFSREFDAPDESVVPEAVFGLKYRRQITDRQKLKFACDYFPSWEDFMDFRMESSASWEIVVEEAWNMSLAIGVVDRYDSTPGSRKPNDIDYTVTLLWKL